MRVLYVNQTSQVSGAERSLLALLKGLGGDPMPVLACPPGELAELAAAQGVETVPVQGTQGSFRLHPAHTSRALLDIARSSFQVRSLIRRLRPDLVHANTTRASLIALASGRRRTPVLAHIRDWAPPGRLSRFVLGTIGRRADAVVANSAYIAAQFDGLALQRPVSVVHNPVDLGHFDPAAADGPGARRGLDLPGEAVVLSAVAQLTPWKGQDDAIRMLATLPDSGTPVYLLLAGSAKFAGAGTQFDNRAYARELRTLASDLGVEERVVFAGERDDVPDLLAATDILLMPSWQEAFGRIAIEAMAMGVPVVATEVGGPAEIVTPGESGLLLPPRRPGVWADALAPLIADAGRRASMGLKGQERAPGFSLAAHAAAVRRLYEQLAAPRSPRPRPL